jgi:hypothetical protein
MRLPGLVARAGQLCLGDQLSCRVAECRRTSARVAWAHAGGRGRHLPPRPARGLGARHPRRWAGFNPGVTRSDTCGPARSSRAAVQLNSAPLACENISRDGRI